MGRLALWRRLGSIAVAGLLAGCGTSTASQVAVGNSGPSIAHSSAATPPPASAQQLLSGHWSVLPAAPIAARAGGSVVWTGSELLVWGGAEGDQDQERYRDGAAYSPSTGRWRLLPSAPLSARVDQATVWTGTEMIVWGGYDQESTEASQVTANGAAYDPSTNRWLMLPASPLSARAGSVAMWTGAEMVILGGQSGQTANSSSQSYGDGAAYDPAAGVLAVDPGTFCRRRAPGGVDRSGPDRRGADRLVRVAGDESRLGGLAAAERRSRPVRV